ncbi:hypothetical protein CMUS01_07412 [Colletotrichum musicola]|uniref:Uncharacterized protein n=1 Tax=Colletotrichum musicola TaxID=2175873 RepID=A0A8H6KHC3_9PEZI|nr:hypothetical protein CMUS01_07412 [Colletotrichum musicola]
MARTPRMDPYFRLLARFYEALVLLALLRPVVGPHVVSQLDRSNLKDTRRFLLKNLAFLCDYDKGGDTTTAIAVEDREDCYVFWVATNEGFKDKVTQFLGDIIDRVKSAAGLPNERDAVERALAVSAQFAHSRIKKEAAILRNAAIRCSSFLGEAGNQGTDDLQSWLGRFTKKAISGLDICKAAYDCRNHEEMRIIERLSHEHETQDSNAPSMKSAPPFRTVRHMVGRLAARVRAVRQLFEDGSRLSVLLQNYRVAGVPKPASATVPEADNLTTLDGVLRRLLPARDDRYEAYLLYLTRLDEQVGLEATLRSKFQPGALKSCVHAEVQMLHHFSDNERRYAGGDRFVSCSKFACVCCDLYFRYHPAGVVLLDSHKKAYPNWGVMMLPEGAKSPKWLDQRKLINDVLVDLKSMVLDQIKEKSVSSLHQQNSISQITPSLVDGDYSDSGTDPFGDINESDSSDSRKPASLLPLQQSFAKMFHSILSRLGCCRYLVFTSSN